MRARRRATAYERLKKYDEAEKDVKVALEIDSTDKAIIQVMSTREAELDQRACVSDAHWWLQLRDRVAELKKRQASSHACA